MRTGGNACAVPNCFRNNHPNPYKSVAPWRSRNSAQASGDGTTYYRLFSFGETYFLPIRSTLIESAVSPIEEREECQQKTQRHVQQAPMRISLFLRERSMSVAQICQSPLVSRFTEKKSHFSGKVVSIKTGLNGPQVISPHNTEGKDHSGTGGL